MKMWKWKYRHDTAEGTRIYYYYYYYYYYYLLLFILLLYIVQYLKFNFVHSRPTADGPLGHCSVRAVPMVHVTYGLLATG